MNSYKNWILRGWEKNQNSREERLMWLLLIESRKPFLCQRIFLPKKGKMSPDILSGLSKNLAITVHESFNCQRTLLTEKKLLTSTKNVIPYEYKFFFVSRCCCKCLRRSNEKFRCCLLLTRKFGHSNKIILFSPVSFGPLILINDSFTTVHDSHSLCPTTSSSKPVNIPVG